LAILHQAVIVFTSVKNSIFGQNSGSAVGWVVLDLDFNFSQNLNYRRSNRYQRKEIFVFRSNWCKSVVSFLLFFRANFRVCPFFCCDSEFSIIEELNLILLKITSGDFAK